MSKNKRNTLIIIAVAVLLFLVLLLIEGFQIGIAGVVSFSTKYYQTPEEAFANFGSQPFEISQSVEYIPIDEYNGMFVGITNENYILVSMQTRDGKYYCSGFYAVLDSFAVWDAFQSNGGVNELYSKWGRYQGKYEYQVVYDEAALQQLDEGFQVHHVASESNRDFYFVYRIR